MDVLAYLMMIFAIVLFVLILLIRRIIFRTASSRYEMKFSGSVQYSDRNRIDKGIYVEHGMVWDDATKTVTPQRKPAANYFETVI